MAEELKKIRYETIRSHVEAKEKYKAVGYRMPSLLKKVISTINSRTIAVIGVAGTTAFGTLDPLVELNEICSDHSIPLHVDAAFGGLVFPFLKKKYVNSPSFNLKSLVSLTVDIHKMGRVPMPGGGLLWRDESCPKAIEFTLPYLASTPKQYTMTGTRSGASAIAFTFP